MHGIFEGEDEVALVKGSCRIRDKENQGGAQEGRQGAVQQLGGDEQVDQDQNRSGHPEGRGDLAVKGEGLGGLEAAVAGGVDARLHYLEGLGAQGPPAGFLGRELHPARGQRAGGQVKFRQEIPLAAGGDRLLLPQRLARPAVHENLHFHFLDALALEVLKSPGQAEAVGGRPGGGPGRRGIKAEGQKQQGHT